MIEFADINEFPKSYALSYDKKYEVQSTYTCGSFEIKDDDNNIRWIDVTTHEFIIEGE